MLRSMNDLENYAIAASDGVIGEVNDLLFDDSAWVIRYFVVETGSWLLSRKILITPIAIQKPDWSEKILHVLISKEQVKNSPNIDTNKPVSRQHEIDYLGYYGYPYYWGGAGIWGGGMSPYALYPSILPNTEGGACSTNLPHENKAHQKEDTNLRSCKAIIGYQIHAKDGDIGHVSGVLLEESTWAVRYLIVDTSNWWLGHKVLISPESIIEVSWLDSSVSVDLSRQLIKDAPEYHSTKELNQQRESQERIT